MAGGTKSLYSLPHKTPNCYASLGFCTWYFQASKIPGYSMEHSCIKSINASYEEKLASNKRMRGIDEYQAAKREARGETRVESRATAPREQPARKHRQAVPKRSHVATLQAEPAPKKARKNSRAETSMPEASLLVLRSRGRKRRKTKNPPCSPSWIAQQGSRDFRRRGAC